MKSIKPGRGPSMMSGIGSVFTVLFGIIWTCAAASMGVPFFFPLFGLIFIGFGIALAVYNFKNATGKNRYSAFDITEDGEEPDPLEEKWGNKQETVFCPYCGNKVDKDFEFCPKCGKKLSE